MSPDNRGLTVSIISAVPQALRFHYYLSLFNFLYCKVIKITSDFSAMETNVFSF